ncbi:hypothetical protein HNQ35_001365 [Cerasibacillus quisquiliarum]|uniref:Uncharacterized protein n=1 Tax=Cerasibacillus quisquiliarum TaxID=227865 RepID=A0A511UWB4_9BACI|nr:DUF5392 family protein [Cerasibacillus quisquiliarum]MBB5146164.1 hypothetical protein [Cerasibacillus quisquiliarum]GEN30899.1 hypothetical protein CQU01_11370 [Cerasibacillus quisquiliarum]
MNVFMTKMPSFIKREIEQLQRIIGPVARKASKYTFWSFPLIIISVVNLVFLLFILPEEYRNSFTLILFAVMGAFGLALSKEAKHQKREIHKLSTDYMIKRIKRSEIVSQSSQNRYIRLIKEQPVHMMHHFVRFLEEEKRQE